jgi:hypothetical protein
VIQATFRIIQATDRALVEQARRLLAQWHYSPALVGECRVRQVVQTPIGGG